MIAIRRNMLKATALLLAFSLVQFYFAFGATSARATNNKASGGLVFGRLAVSENQTIFLNGNKADAGATIFSGAELQTLDTVNATVQIPSVGRLEMSPNSKLTLDFTRDSVNVRLSEGDATLTTFKGIDGSLTTPDGTMVRSDPSKSGSVLTSRAGASSRAAWDDWSNGQKAAAIIIPIVAAIIIIAVVVSDDDDDSPNNP
jgi:hypothetical protein